jgi:hypothetical protein
MKLLLAAYFVKKVRGGPKLNKCAVKVVSLECAKDVSMYKLMLLKEC